MKKIILLPTVLLFLCTGLASAKSKNSVTKKKYFDTITTANNDSIKNKHKKNLEEISISKHRQKRTGTVVKSGINPLDLPQSVQVLGTAILTQQQTLRLSEVIKNANGVYVSSARGGAQESFYSRGYDMSSNNMFKNGFRFNGGSMPEVASLQKVEILKGSSALLYGNVAPGGILNLVTKTPMFRHGAEVNMQFGSYSFYKPTIDIYGPLSNTIAYRLVGTYENSKSFRDIVTRDRFYINPSFLFKASAKTEIIIQADYLKDNWTPDFGTGAIGPKILDLPRNIYLGATWSKGLTVQTAISALVNHNFNDNWKLNINTSYQNFERTSKATERIQPLENGNWKRPLGENKALEQIIAEQVSLQGIFNTWKIKHQLYFGLDSEHSIAEAYTYLFNPNTYGSGNVFDMQNFDQGTGIPDSNNTKIVKTAATRFGASLQDLISFNKYIKLLVGTRWSWQESKADTYNLLKIPTEVQQGEIRIDKAFTPKLGIVYQPFKATTVFASYATSFTPNSGYTNDNKPLEPSIIDQYEVGVKKHFFNQKIITNITAYQIVNNNLAQTAEFKADGTTLNTDTNLKALTGQTTSKGIELDIEAKPTKSLSILAGYSFNNMEYTKTNGNKGSYIVGDRLVRTPKNTANISFFYTISSGKLQGLSFGSIANYIGDRLGGWNNTIGQIIPDRIIPINGYTTIDASVGYTWKNVSILCKLSNISNALNYTVHENYSINPIAPRQFLSTIKYKF